MRSFMHSKGPHSIRIAHARIELAGHGAIFFLLWRQAQQFPSRIFGNRHRLGARLLAFLLRFSSPGSVHFGHFFNPWRACTAPPSMAVHHARARRRSPMMTTEVV